MRQPAGSELNSPLRGAGSAPCGPTAAMGHPWHCAPQCPACPVLLLTIIGDAQRRACSDPGPSWSSAAPHSHRCTKSKQGMGGGEGGCMGRAVLQGSPGGNWAAGPGSPQSCRGIPCGVDGGSKALCSSGKWAHGEPRKAAQGHRCAWGCSAESSSVHRQTYT